MEAPILELNKDSSIRTRWATIIGVGAFLIFVTNAYNKADSNQVIRDMTQEHFQEIRNLQQENFQIQLRGRVRAIEKADSVAWIKADHEHEDLLTQLKDGLLDVNRRLDTKTKRNEEALDTYAREHAH